MFGHFTDDVRRSMQAAKQEATQLGHKHVGVAHLLLGVLAQPGSVVDACHSLGVNRSSIEQAVRSEMASETFRSSKLSAKVIDYAIDESSMLEHNAISTVHLMLGILRAAPPRLVGALQEVGL